MANLPYHHRLVCGISISFVRDLNKVVYAKESSALQTEWEALAEHLLSNHVMFTCDLHYFTAL